eukprot:TRINITY_DN10688_c0_g1_i7.p2 TRINITY_DN10688_c0_g1~~TRINITY_DN10688_c0_g1_i7.p2  ORF type:complete len:406 (-),score=106.63 TRINITY_DN10688_c0_g1_i7:98-1315(-)
MSFIVAASKGLAGSEVSLGNVMYTGLNALYYKVFAEECRKAAEGVMHSPNPQALANTAGLLDQKFSKVILKLIMPRVKVNKKIYVVKLLSQLKLEMLMNWKDEALKKRDESLLVGKESYISGKLKPVPDDYVKVRILAPDTLPYECKPGETPKTKFSKILVDIHGGGFIATTSRCHQTYLRKWANECNLVVFAIDYKLAPKSKYPLTLDDVWQAYYWIITQATKEFKIDLETVLIAGDSAGGNLAMAVSLLAVRYNFRVPDGILLGYPALSLSMTSFTPSLLEAFDDFILHYSVLTLCLNSYVPPEGDPTKDPFLSPSLIPDEDLKKFPPVRILAAGRDPLRDESYRLINRLASLNKDAKLIEYRMLPHGFWSLDMIFTAEECKLAARRTIEWINELASNAGTKT